jgi:hypothetical protein
MTRWLLGAVIGLTALPALAQPATPQATGPRKRTNEKRAIGIMKTLGSCQSLFREGDKDANGELDYADSIKALVKTNLLADDLADGESHGYTFVVNRSAKTPQFLWMAVAAPTKPGISGDRYFATNHAGVVYHSLKPIPLVDDCAIKGVPVGGELKGFDPAAGFSPRHKLLMKLAKIGIERRERFFRDAKSERFHIVELRARSESWRAFAGTVVIKTGVGEMAGYEMDGAGLLEQVEKGKVSITERGTRPPKGAPAGGKLKLIDLETDKVVATGVYRQDMLPASLVLFGLSSFAARGKLPLPFECRLTDDAFTKEQPQAVLSQLASVPALDGHKPAAAYQLACGKRIWTVWLDAQHQPMAFKGPDGALFTSSDRDTFQTELMSHHKEALEKAMGKRLKGARRLGNETAAIGAMKVLSTAQVLFREGDKDANGTLDYANGLEDLGKCGLIDKVLASGTKQGYRFELTSGAKAPEFTWMAVASPVKPGVTGSRHFAVNHEGVIYTSDTPFVLDGVTCKIKGGKPLGR